MAAVTPPPPAAANTPPAVVEDSLCKKIVQKIEEIAIQILIPLALAVGIYFAFPFSVAAIVIPVAVTASLIAMTYFFNNSKSAEENSPLPKTAPVGLLNSNGANCWLNSLLQMIRIDRGMNKWFTEVPLNLDIHAGYLIYFSEELLENLPAVLPEEAYGNLGAADPGRAIIDQYANALRLMPADQKALFVRYMEFLRKFPLAHEPNVTPLIVARALLELKKFITLYNEGQRDRPGQALRQSAPPVAPGAKAQEPALYSSHALRLALGSACPRINLTQDLEHNPNSQQDPTEALPWIGDCLLPDHLKVQMQERKRYTYSDLAPILDVRDEPLTLGVLSCAIVGSYPNMQNFLSRHWEELNDDPNNQIRRQIDGVDHLSTTVKTERQFLTAPSSLWLPIKRFDRTHSQWLGLHRMIPDLFSAEVSRSVKNNDSVECQEIIELQPVNGPLARYELDGFIVQHGALEGGHYTSYERGVDEAGNKIWFLMDDSRVTRVSEAQMREALKKSYMPHYSKLEDPA